MDSKRAAFVLDVAVTYNGSGQATNEDLVEAKRKAMKILEADAEGKLVWLPCNVGDTVWFVYKGKIHEMRVQGISVTQSRRVILNFGGYPFVNSWADEVGRTVFLTREAAEKMAEYVRGGGGE